MRELFEWLSGGSTSALLLVVAFTIVLVAIVLMYIIAFAQGREVSFWPPKIGKKISRSADTKTQTGTNRPTLEQPAHLVAGTLNLKRTDIVIESNAHYDSKMLGISVDDLTDYVLGEANRHPALFMSTFSSNTSRVRRVPDSTILEWLSGT